MISPNLQNKLVGSRLLILHHALLFDNFSDESEKVLMDKNRPITDLAKATFLSRIELFDSFQFQVLFENLLIRDTVRQQRIYAKLQDDIKRNVNTSTRKPRPLKQTIAETERYLLENNQHKARNTLSSSPMGNVITDNQISYFFGTQPDDIEQVNPHHNSGASASINWQDIYHNILNMKKGKSQTPSGFLMDIILHMFKLDQLNFGDNGNDFTPVNPSSPIQNALNSLFQSIASNTLPIEFWSTFFHRCKGVPLLKTDDNNNIKKIPHSLEYMLRIIGAGNPLALAYYASGLMPGDRERANDFMNNGNYGSSKGGLDIARHHTNMLVESTQHESQIKRPAREIINPINLIEMDIIKTNQNTIFTNVENAFREELDLDNCETFQNIKESFTRIANTALNIDNQNTDDIFALMTNQFYEGTDQLTAENITANGISSEDLLEKGFGSKDIKSAHGSFDRKKAFIQAVQAEPNIETILRQAAGYTQSIIIPTGDGSFHNKTLVVGMVQGMNPTGLFFKRLTGPITEAIKAPLALDLLSIEDDILVYGTILQRILAFYLAEKLLMIRGRLTLQWTKCKLYGPHKNSHIIASALLATIFTNNPQPTCIPHNQGFKFAGTWFGNHDFIKYKVQLQLVNIAREFSELNQLPNFKQRFNLLRICDVARASHIARSYDPRLFCDIFNDFDQLVVNYLVSTSEAVPIEERQTWWRSRKRIFFSTKNGGLGLPSLATSGHAAWLASLAYAMNVPSGLNPTIDVTINAIKSASNLPTPIARRTALLRLHHQDAREIAGISTSIGHTVICCIDRLTSAIVPHERNDTTGSSLQNNIDMPHFLLNIPALTIPQKNNLPNSENFWRRQGKGQQRNYLRHDKTRRRKALRNIGSPDDKVTFDASCKSTSGHQFRGHGAGRNKVSNNAFTRAIQLQLNLPLQFMYQFFSQGILDSPAEDGGSTNLHMPSLPLSYPHRTALTQAIALNQNQNNIQNPNPNQPQPPPPIQNNPQNPQLNIPPLVPPDPPDPPDPGALLHLPPTLLCSLCNTPQDNLGLHCMLQCCFQNKLTIHNTCLADYKLFMKECHLNVHVKEEPTNIFKPGFDADNRRGDIAMEFGNKKYIIDFKIQGHTYRNGSLRSLLTGIKAKERATFTSYQHIKDEYTFIPFVIGINGQIGNAGTKFLRTLCDYMVSLGTYQAWQFYQIFLPNWLCSLTRGIDQALDIHADKIANQSNPQAAVARNHALHLDIRDHRS